MARVITFSRTFPAYHPKAGQPTHFVEQILNSFDLKMLPTISRTHPIFTPTLCPEVKGIKWHTIRSGNRWKEGELFSPRVWSGKPYNSKQIIIAPDIEIQKIFDFRITTERNSEMRDDLSNFIYIYDKIVMNNDFKTLCTNDGLSVVDFCDWFNICFEDDYKTTSFHGQIICWNKDINY